jgi:hypothetical protein
LSVVRYPLSVIRYPLVRCPLAIDALRLHPMTDDR